MNRRHKTGLALSLAIAGLALLNGAQLSEALGIILVGASLAWLVGARFVLAGAMLVWRHRVWFAIITILVIAGVYGWIRYDAYQTQKQIAAFAKMKDCGTVRVEILNFLTQTPNVKKIRVSPFSR